MVEDPYKVLGISQDASPEEIKKAYRRKAKEYHPDLHPDDPNATKKMNEVNEAYDMLTNPEKYAARRVQQQAKNQAGGYGGYGSQGGYGGYQQQNRQQNQNQGYNGYRGTGGWYSDFGGFDFDFEDLFGFGFGSTGQQASRPTEMPGDSPAVRAVIQDINSHQYQLAINRLSQIQSTGRNGRWYYLSALANKGLGNTMQATEQIQRAIQLEPNNAAYRQIYQQLRQSAQSYQQHASGSGFNMDAMDMQRFCMGMCAFNFFCNFCRCI